MKERDLRGRICNIEARLTQLDLPMACIRVMQHHGTFRTESHDDYTGVDGFYSDDAVQMSYKGNRSCALSVSYGGQEVLHCQDGMVSDVDEKTKLKYPRVSLFYVHLFRPGVWVSYVIDLDKKPGKQKIATSHKKSSPETEEIPEKVLSELKERYRGFFD